MGCVSQETFKVPNVYNWTDKYGRITLVEFKKVTLWLSLSMMKVKITFSIFHSDSQKIMKDF